MPHALQAHAGNGVCLANLLLDLEDDDTLEKAVAVVNGLSDRFKRGRRFPGASKSAIPMESEIEHVGKPRFGLFGDEAPERES